MKQKNGLTFRRNLGGWKLHRNFVALGFLALCILSLLAGCQILNSLPLLDNSLSTITSSPTAMQTQIQPVTTPAATESSTTNTLTIWLPPQFDPENGSAAGNLLKDRLARFQEEHPEFTIEVRIKAVTGTGGLLDALQTTSAAAPSALPALIALPYPEMDSAATAGLLQTGVNGSINLNDDDWLPYARELSTIGDKVYGVPFAGDALVLAYRPLQSPHPPTSWEGMADQAEIISFPAADPDAVIVRQIYLSTGGSFVDENNMPVIQSQPLQSTFEIISGISQSNVFPYWIADLSTFDQSWNAFINQQANYALVWASQYLQTGPENVLVTSIPRVGQETTTLANGWLWCVPGLSNVEEQNSLLLAEYLSDPEFINSWAHAAGYLPVRQSGIESWNNLSDAQEITELVSHDQLTLLSAPDGVTTPLLQDAAVQIIRKQTYYQQLLDSILSKFQVK